jgi:hypothetical protein
MLPKTKNKLFALLFLLTGCSTTTSADFGKKYLGVKYQFGPLGEEKLPDNDPLIRFDAFDCTTFVETVLADGDKEKLTKIRYKNGKVDIVNRNHFVETDWLSNNNFENVSRLYGDTSIRHIVVDKKSWFKKKYGIDTDFQKQNINIEYIPYEKISKINIQSPLIVLFIHDGNVFRDKIGTDLAVVHMGFLLPGNVLRHASRQYGRVTDVDFETYINKHKRNKHNLGITLVKTK